MKQVSVKVLSLVLSVLLITSVFSLPVSAIDVEAENSGAVDAAIIIKTHNDRTDDPLVSGSAGYSAKYSLYSDGSLYIYGDGYMSSYNYKSDIPWYSYKDKITSITIEPGITSIGNTAFADCAVKNVDIACSVVSIGACAFENCTKLDYIDIPISVTEIGNYAFRNCSALNNVRILRCTKRIGDGAFSDCTSLANLTISDGVQEIADSAFKNCTALKSVKLPESITKMGTHIFANCNSLSSVTLPENLTEIPDNCFSSCTGLTEITFPTSVSSVGFTSFANCTALKEITFKGNKPTMSYLLNVDYPFDGVKAQVSYPENNSSWENIESTWNGGGEMTFGAVVAPDTDTNSDEPDDSSEGGLIFKQVSLGYEHSAAITTEGSLYTWGYNLYGQLGDGTTADKYTPTKVMDNVVSVSLGYFHSAAITTDGSLYTWGNNYNGRLGDGTTENRYTPTKIMDKVVSVSLGSSHSAAITTDGSLYTWGSNYCGKLGDGTTEERYTPTKVMDNVVSVSLGYFHSAAITTDGSLYTWGHNYSGQLGDGTADKCTPTKVMDNVVSVSLGYFHSAAITTDGSLYTWGCNDDGQLGDGTTEHKYTPTKIMDNVVSVSLGVWHSAAITNDGSLYTWGHNYNGQLGDGAADKFTPTKVMDNVVSVSLGYFDSAAITNDGSLYTWGHNYNGQLGDGTVEDRYTPTKITKVQDKAPSNYGTVDMYSFYCPHGTEPFVTSSTQETLKWEDGKYDQEEIKAELVIKNETYSGASDGNLNIDSVKFELAKLPMFEIEGSPDITAPFTLAPGETKTIQIKLKKKGLLWKKPDNTEDIDGYINAYIKGSKKEGDIEKNLGITVTYHNEDLKKKQDGSDDTEYFHYCDKEIEEELSKFTLGWNEGGFRNVGFTDAEIEAVEYCAKVWTMQIYSTISIVKSDPYYKKILDKIGDDLKGKYNNLVLEALGCRTDLFDAWMVTKLTTQNANADTVVEIPHNGVKYQVHINLNIDSYAFEGDNAYAGFGTISYYITDMKGSRVDQSLKSGKGYTGVVTQTDLMQFGKSMESVAKQSVKNIYSNSIAKAIDKKIDAYRKQINRSDKTSPLVKAMTSDVTNYIIKKKFGSYSGNIFKITAKQVENFYKKTCIKCPVDVFVYNSQNELCGSVVNNVPAVYSEDISVEVIGDEKQVIYPADDDYRFELIGNDSGTMDYEVLTYTEDGELLRKREYTDIPLESGLGYTSVVSSNPYSDMFSCDPMSYEGDIITYTADSYLDEAEPYISVESVAVESTDIRIAVDETSEIKAHVQPDNAYNQCLRYVSNDESVATVSLDGVIKGVSSGETTVSVISEDGEHEGTVNVTVVSIESYTDTSTDVASDTDSDTSTEIDSDTDSETKPDQLSEQEYKQLLIDLLIENEHKEAVDEPNSWADFPWGDNAAKWDDSVTKVGRTEAGRYPSMYFLDIDNDGYKEFIINDDGWEASIDNAIWIYDIVDGKLDVSYAGMSGKSFEIYSGNGEYLVLTTYKEPYFDGAYEMYENVSIDYEAVLEKNSENSDYMYYSLKNVARSVVSNEGNKDKEHYYKYETVVDSSSDYTYDKAVEITEDEYKKLKSDLIGNKTKAVLNYDLIQAKDYSQLTEQEKRETLSEAYDSSKITIPDQDNCLLGDLDFDGSITSADALAVLRISVGLASTNGKTNLIADVDGDGSITSADALEILRCSVGLSTTLGNMYDDNEYDPLGGEGKNGTINIKVWSSKSAQDTIQKQCDTFSDKMKPYGNIKIDVLPYGEAEAALSVLANPSSSADVFSFASDKLNDLVTAGDLLEVTDSDKEFVISENSIYSVKAATKDNRIWAFPETGDVSYLLVYNKKYVTNEQAKTLEGTLQACRAANKKFVMDAGNGYYSCIFMFTGGLTIDGLEEDGVTQKFSSYDEDKAVKTMLAFQKLFMEYKDCFISEDVSNIIEGFESDTVAAGIDGSWHFSSIKQVLAENAGFSVLPTINVDGASTPIVNLFDYKLLGVNSSTQYPNTAIELGKYLSGEECQMERTTQLGWGPTNNAAAKSDFVQKEEALNSIFNQQVNSVPQVGIVPTFWTPVGALGCKIADYDNPLNKAEAKKLIKLTIANIRDE